jgi:hypothetical protein
VIPLALMLGMSALALVAFRNTIVPLLSGGRLHVGLAMASATGVWMVMAGLRAVLSVVAGGCGLLRHLAVAVPICAGVAFLPCLLLSRATAPVELPLLATAACELAIAAVVVYDTRNLLRLGAAGRVGRVDYEECDARA